MFSNKKNVNTGAVEGYGKTEPIANGGFGNAGPMAGGNFGKTEPLFGNGGGFNIGEVPPTSPAPGGPGGLVDTEALFSNNPGPAIPSTSPIESYGHTMPAVQITTNIGEKVQPVVGWLLCIKGANVGKEYRIHSDYNYVGSASGDIVIQGDPKISREKHMLVTYDPETRVFYVAPASGANIVRLNDKSLVGGAQELHNYDVIRTGDTSLMFIGFCGEQFGWEQVTNV